MKSFLFRQQRNCARGGFNLVEATFSIGLISCGFLALVPLLALGLKTSQFARNDRTTAQIAQTLIEEARQGILPAGTTYLDIDGNASDSTTAAYTTQTTFQPIAGNSFLTQLTLRIIPRSAPNRARTYAVVFPASS